jgi:hypothetical protein
MEETITPLTLAQIEQNKLLEVSQEERWTQVQVDSQVLSMFMSCPQKYKYIFIDHLKPIVKKSKYIRRGTVVHDSLLQYWKERIINPDNYQKAIQDCVSLAKERVNAEDDFDAEFKLETLQGIVDYLKHLQSSSWIPIAAEKHFRLKVYEDESIRLRIFITGRIDLILRTPQVPVLPIDVKTESERWFYSQMSNQFRIYNLACGTNLLGVQRIGFQKTLTPEEKFKMELLPFDEDILEEFRTITLPYWVKQLILANEDSFFPMNTSNCIHGHFKCQFSDAYNGGICNVSRTVRAQKLSRYFVVGPEWDPANLED